MNEPLRGRKGELYEGGIRTPALVNWPVRLRPAESAAPLHVCDWMPTLCAPAGYRPPQNLKWDGRDTWPVLSHPQKPTVARLLYWLGRNSKSSALRQGNWKLPLFDDQPAELYDLARDPGETRDLAPEHPKRVAELRELMARQAARDRDSVVKE